MPWAMTPWSLSYINKTFTCTAGVSFSCLSPFLLRYILSCLQSSFSIKRETDRDRTTAIKTRCELLVSIVINLLYSDSFYNYHRKTIHIYMTFHMDHILGPNS